MTPLFLPLLALLFAFTIQASTEQSIVIPLPAAEVSAFYADLGVYRRHFPGIVDTRRLSATESLWTYVMDPPLSPAKRMTLRLVQHNDSEHSVVFSTAPDAADFMLCRATVVPLSERETKLTVSLQLRLTRESGSDFHFLAPVLGQSFISNEMQKQVTGDLEQFLRKTKDVLLRQASAPAQR
jgi:hypothetical protein